MDRQPCYPAAGLAQCGPICQAAVMQKSRNTAAGGVFIVLFLFVGIYLGIRSHNLTAYMFGGFAVGVIVAVLIWLVDRRRS